MGKTAPAMTPAAREQQIAAMAFNLAEQKILDGTASDSLIIAAMKFGSTRERIEQDNLKSHGTLMNAKVDSIKQGAVKDQLYEKAIAAMRAYQGQPPEEFDSNV